MLAFWSLVLLFGIVRCWRSISCFRLLASLPYMSIRAGVIVTVTFHEVDRSPDTKACTKSYYESLKYAYCAVKKCHNVI